MKQIERLDSPSATKHGASTSGLRRSGATCDTIDGRQRGWGRGGEYPVLGGGRKRFDGCDAFCSPEWGDPAYGSGRHVIDASSDELMVTPPRAL